MRRNVGTADVDDADVSVALLIQEHKRIRFLCAGIDDRRTRKERMHRSGNDLSAEIRERHIAHADQLCKSLFKDCERFFRQRGRFRGLPFGRIDDDDLVLLHGFRLLRNRLLRDLRFRRRDCAFFGVRAGEQRSDRQDHERPCNEFLHKNCFLSYLSVYLSYLSVYIEYHTDPPAVNSFIRNGSRDGPL